VPPALAGTFTGVGTSAAAVIATVPSAMWARADPVIDSSSPETIKTNVRMEKPPRWVLG
jgi:hypothetical protein